MVPTLTEVVFPIVALAVADLVEAIVVVPVLDGTMVLARPVVSLMAAKRLPKPSLGSDIIDVENFAPEGLASALILLGAFPGGPPVGPAAGDTGLFGRAPADAEAVGALSLDVGVGAGSRLPNALILLVAASR